MLSTFFVLATFQNVFLGKIKWVARVPKKHHKHLIFFHVSNFKVKSAYIKVF